MLRFGLAILALAVLAACSTLGVPERSAVRSLDYANDDIASLLIAFDLPETIEPMAEGPALRIDVDAAESGRRTLRAVLVRSDAGELAGTLPPPGDGRNYYLFGFSDADGTAIRETQAWAKSLPPGQGGGLAITLEPRFCASEAVDANRIRFSVQLALPGSASLAPLIRDQSLAAALEAAGATLPICEGHSG